MLNLSHFSWGAAPNPGIFSDVMGVRLFCVYGKMIVHLTHGTGGDADDRDVIKDDFGRPCLLWGIEKY